VQPRDEGAEPFGTEPGVGIDEGQERHVVWEIRRGGQQIVNLLAASPRCPGDKSRIPDIYFIDNRGGKRYNMDMPYINGGIASSRTYACIIPLMRALFIYENAP
jgi:hypothetical protein